MRIHIAGLTHTIVNREFSHCAFTSNLMRFAKMMRAQGCEVIEYGNEGSESQANEHVILRTRAVFDQLHPRPAKTTVEKDPGVGSASHTQFVNRLWEELRPRARTGDFFVHAYGLVYEGILKAFPELIHVEPFIGYDAGPFGAYRGFVTEAWRHYHLGRYTQHDNDAARESWVLPMFYDVADWPVGKGDGGYFAFLARKCNAKGLKVLAEIIRRYDGPHHFEIAGPGEEWRDWQEFVRDVTPEIQAGKVKNRGVLKSEERADFLGRAVALLCPTQYVEPGGGVAIEAQMCGTPVIASDWGCFTETVPRGLRCRTVDDYLTKMTWDFPAHRFQAQNRAARFGLASAGYEFRKVFEQIRAIHEAKKR